MNKVLTILLAAIVLFTSSCASIVSKTRYPISISSQPLGANVSITDKEGVTVFQGKTPVTVKLKSGAGYFAKAEYQIKFEREGYETRIIPLYASLDGWYFLNILTYVGIGLGMLIIDPATGAMYRLKDKFIDEILDQRVTAMDDEQGLHVFSMDEIPEEWKTQLISFE